MKRVACALFVMVLVVSFASNGYAQNPAAKLGRGLLNTLTGLWELPIDILRTSKHEGGPKGLTVGLARGLATGLYRTLVGVYEVVTFAIPLPAGYRPITDPDTLLTAETLVPGDPAMRSDFRPLSSEYEGSTRRNK